jgi:predicted GIY-YIG superfamily endonuclease
MKGIIYKISNGEKNYIGCTTQPLNIRFSKHKNNYKRFLQNKTNQYCSYYEIIKEKDKPYNIEILEEIECETKIDLHSLEKKHISENNCVNIYYTNVSRSSENKKQS